MRYFCEYLESIRTAHLHIELDSPWDVTCSELLVHDRKHLTLRHRCISVGIALPCSLERPERPPELVIDADRLVLDCRIKDAAPVVLQDDSNNETPFSRPEDLQTLTCCRCQTLLVDGRSLTWRSLPSEHWAELMDSWHCHKGVIDDAKAAHARHRSNDNQLHEQYTLPDRIVSAANRIRPAVGVGLIGLSYLLFRPAALAFLPEVSHSHRHRHLSRSNRTPPKDSKEGRPAGSYDPTHSLHLRPIHEHHPR